MFLWQNPAVAHPRWASSCVTESRVRIFDDERRRRSNTRLARLESDMAYFQARLEILGEAKTANQKAQSRTFKLLYKSIGAAIVREKHRMMDNG